jgi:hypothetical protein
MHARSRLQLIVCVSLAGCGGEPGDSGGDEANTTSGPEGDGDGDESGETGEQPAFCEKDGDADNPSFATQPDPEHQHTVTGENGSFTDECDRNGNLLEYVCEVISECVDPPNPICNYYQSGDAVALMFDCAGTCMDGTCVARCPDFGDILEYVAIDGDAVTLSNQNDGRSYDCVLSFDNASDSYDCSTEPTVGATTVVGSLGLGGPWCTGTQAFNVGTGDPQQCTYMCTMIP